jgi:hypothetical protein
LFRYLTALPSNSIVHKGFPHLIAARGRLAGLQAASPHLNIIEVFDAGLDQFARELGIRLPPAFSQFAQRC